MSCSDENRPAVANVSQSNGENWEESGGGGGGGGG